MYYTFTSHMPTFPHFFLLSAGIHSTLFALSINIYKNRRNKAINSPLKNEKTNQHKTYGILWLSISSLYTSLYNIKLCCCCCSFIHLHINIYRLCVSFVFSWRLFWNSFRSFHFTSFRGHNQSFHPIHCTGNLVFGFAVDMLRCSCLECDTCLNSLDTLMFPGFVRF